MELFVGTSGYSYPEWKGKFYPEKLPQRRMLQFYGECFRGVEVNYTFRSRPTVSQLEGWASQVPADFRFALKAPEQWTHRQQLRDAEAALGPLWEVAVTLKGRLGPLLVQLPPSFKKDAARLREALAALPSGCRAAFEFRHPSWHDDEVFDLLREHNATLCLAETGGERDAPWIATADWGYVRLRQTTYSDAELRGWQQRLHGQPWREAFVFFMHEEEAHGPRLAKRLLELAA